MERERLSFLVQDPASVGREDLTGLRELADRFPWFAGAHLLRAMGERGTGEVLHEESLMNAAAHLPTRVPLFAAAHPEPAAPVFHMPLTPVIAATPAAPPSTAPPAPVPADHTVEAPPEALPAEEPTGAEEGPLVATTPDGPAQVVASAPVSDVLDLEIRRSAMATGYELLLEHAPELAMPVEPATEPSGAAIAAQVPPVHAPEAETPQAPSPAAAPVARAGQRMRFTAWLSEPAAAADPAPAAVGMAPASAPAPIPACIEEPSVPPVASPAPPLDTDSLIDRFIRQATPEIRPKAAFFTPQQAAKKSLDDTAGLVTETLARIYESQGNIVKAIEAYRKLALKYPEKSAYFAALQKGLEDRSHT
jgi:hypothetical protein